MEYHLKQKVGAFKLKTSALTGKFISKNEIVYIYTHTLIPLLTCASSAIQSIQRTLKGD